MREKTSVFKFYRKVLQNVFVFLQKKIISTKNCVVFVEVFFYTFCICFLSEKIHLKKLHEKVYGMFRTTNFLPPKFFLYIVFFLSRSLSIGKTSSVRSQIYCPKHVHKLFREVFSSDHCDLLSVFG